MKRPITQVASVFGQLSMPVNTILPTSSHHHHRIQLSDSHPLRYRLDEDSSNSTVSDSSYGVETLIVGGQRRVRAVFRETPLKESRSRAKRAMTSPYPRRTYSESKTNTKETYVKEPRVVTREVRRKSDSEHRHHHRKPEEKVREERVSTHRTQRKSEGEVDRSKPITLRRSTTNAGEASKTRHERPRTADRERHSERRPYHHEEKVRTPLRHEKRSIADHTPTSTRDRAPTTR